MSLVILVCVISLCVSVGCVAGESEAYSLMNQGLSHRYDSSYYALWSNAGGEGGQSVCGDNHIFMLYDGISLDDSLEYETVSDKIYTACCKVQFANTAISPDDSSDAEIARGIMKSISHSQGCCNVYSNAVTKALQSYAVTDVPEPTTMLLFATGLIGVVAFKRRKLLKKSDELN